MHSFIRSLIRSPSLCEAQDAPGVELGIGNTEMGRWMNRSDKAQPCRAQSLVGGETKQQAGQVMKVNAL